MVRGASDTRPASHSEGWFPRIDDAARVNARHIDGDVDPVGAKLDEDAISRWRVPAEASRIVADVIQRSKALNQA